MCFSNFGRSGLVLVLLLIVVVVFRVRGGEQEVAGVYLGLPPRT